uniref:Uncharacterized protein n=1 Tax=Cacopsylla melanoneura TaxID=428564 RepID=A0A8D8T0H6_9HEMI
MLSPGVFVAVLVLEIGASGVFVPAFELVLRPVVLAFELALVLVAVAFELVHLVLTLVVLAFELSVLVVLAFELLVLVVLLLVELVDSSGTGLSCMDSTVSSVLLITSSEEHSVVIFSSCLVPAKSLSCLRVFRLLLGSDLLCLLVGGDIVVFSGVQLLYNVVYNFIDLNPLQMKCCTTAISNGAEAGWLF